MNTNNNLPTEIYDFIEQKNLAQLTAAEFNYVLKFITENDYIILRETYLDTKKNVEQSNSQQPSNKVFEHLSAQMQLKNKLTNNIFVIEKSYVGFMKIAAMFFILFSTAFISKKHFANAQIRTLYATKIDTVFVNKLIAAKPKNDTVFVIEKVVETAVNIHNYDNISVENENFKEPVNQINLPLCNIKKLRENSLQSIGKSVAEDSLVKTIGFVSL